MALAVLDHIGSVTQSLVAAFAKGIFKIGMPLRRRLRSAGPTSAGHFRSFKTLASFSVAAFELDPSYACCGSFRPPSID
jgi:hypothetical protein